MANQTWTDMEDRVLYSTRDQYPNETWSFVAGTVSSKLGRMVSADAAEKRYKRILRGMEFTETWGAMELPENAKPVDYAGFRMGFYDIESTDLGAMMGRVLCLSVADEFGIVTTKTYADFDGKSILDDAPLVEWIMRELDQYDILVSWNGKLFDKPFLNARAMKGLVVPMFPLKMHIDLMYQFKGSQARFGSAKMDNVAKALGVPHQKTPLDFETWERASVGDQDALESVVEHCEADVLTMRDIFARAKRLIGTITR